ncbi:hypothetical protein OA92_12425 [Marinomonas sp. SBI22]|uniref:PqiC family protein n=1 Tax=unclassified Marinomonas TaxID=196814 RepID=UPI0007AF0C42|nr:MULTISPECIES: PqiC family protein [unclassified Marinomonas]KZM42035.1 hypothetical protein OA92_12425 [Marinomonas sp. SBI22]KZM47122.1 hypothetical protein OA91_00980 [Marinomonas sp. SBI8L]
MNLMRIIPIFISVLLLGCNSQPTPTSHYYILNQQLDTQGLANLSPIREVQLSLPEYLKQPNLVLQLSEHELSYAYYHTWAENLDDAIQKGLDQDLRKLVKEKIASGNQQDIKANTQVSLILDIDHFYATIDSKVVLTGSYSFINTQETQALSPKYNFTFKAEIEADGYPHSVAKMRQLILALAKDILINYQKVDVTL